MLLITSSRELLINITLYTWEGIYKRATASIYNWPIGWIIPFIRWPPWTVHLEEAAGKLKGFNIVFVKIIKYCNLIVRASLLYQYFDLTFNFLISGTKLYPTFVTNRYVDCRGEIADKRKSGASKALVVSKFKSIIIFSYVDSVVTLYYNIIYLPRINRTFFFLFNKKTNPLKNLV